jgi:hypothetical protein
MRIHNELRLVHIIVWYIAVNSSRCCSVVSCDCTGARAYHRALPPPQAVRQFAAVQKRSADITPLLLPHMYHAFVSHPRPLLPFAAPPQACPFAGRQFATVQKLVPLMSGEGVQFKMYQVPQPWHPQSTLMHGEC